MSTIIKHLVSFKGDKKEAYRICDEFNTEALNCEFISKEDGDYIEDYNDYELDEFEMVIFVYDNLSEYLINKIFDMSETYKNVEITIKYADESDIGRRCGMYVCNNRNIISKIEYDSLSKTSFNFAVNEVLYESDESVWWDDDKNEVHYRCDDDKEDIDNA